MARGLLVGMTDYSHQTFQDILDDLDIWKASLLETIDFIQKTINQLEDNRYWNKVPTNMKSIVAYAIRFFTTSWAEIDEISQKLKIEVQQNHISRLQSLANTSHKLDMDFSTVWHQQYSPKEYGNPDFTSVERIYAQGRGMAADMLDLSNVAARLETFLGMKSLEIDLKKPKKPLVSIFLFILGIFIGIVSNVASDRFPLSWQSYLWLSWPLVGILTFVGVILLKKNEA